MNTRYTSQLPRQVLPNLKSIGQKAKQVATMLNERKDDIRNEFNNKNPHKEGIFFTTQDDQKECFFNFSSYDNHYSFDYQGKNFHQLTTINRFGDAIVNDECLSDELAYCNIFKDEIVIQKKIGSKKLAEIDEFYRTYCYRPPEPRLKITKDTGVWKIYYSNIHANRPIKCSEAELFQRSQQHFVNHTWPAGSPAAIYAKQYNIINKFIDIKDEVLDKPVELATMAYEMMKGMPMIDPLETIIIDTKENGERIEIKKQQGKQGEAFDVTFYDEEDKMTMSGVFEIVRDENGHPLKEAEDGKILKEGDPNYNDTQKLCFDISLKTYYSDIDTTPTKTNFTRVVSATQNGKYRHIMNMSTWDRQGENLYCYESTEDEAFSRYSKDWLDKRFSKVYYSATKHELKQEKHDLLSMRLNPADVGLSPDQQDSIISQINADNLDSNDIRTPQPVAQ